MTYLHNLPQPFFVLAPMDDVTDTVFRQVVARCAAPEVFVTEFVNVDGLQSVGRDRVIKRLQHTDSEHPLVAQLWGKHPENFYKTAAELAEMGYDGIDLNMGCPDKTVVKNGTCSALINDRPLASEIIKATQEGAREGARRVSSYRRAVGDPEPLPVSVKTRLGFTTVDPTWHEFLLGHDLALLAVHGRTRKEMSAVPAHWDLIGAVRQLRDTVAPDTLIVGNGDVDNRAHGLELAERYGLDGIMIGRGIFRDPYAFAPDSPWTRMTPLERLDLYERHITLFAATWQNRERAVVTLNKFCKIYVSGFDGAKELRERLMNAHETGELLGILRTARNHIAGQPLATEARISV